MLNSDDRDAIAEAVREAERQTSGEIVVVVDRAAGSYVAVPLVLALALSLFVPWPFLLITNLSAASIFLAQLIAAALLLAALLTVLVIRLVLRAPTVRLAWHRRQLRLPVIGRLVRGVQTARFASTLAILVSSGVPLIRALEAGARTLSNEALRDNVHDGIGRVREGVPLARALAAAQQFPPMLVHLVASGEATGRLPEMLDRAAATLSAEAERRTLTLTSLLEPLLILVMG